MHRSALGNVTTASGSGVFAAGRARRRLRTGAPDDWRALLAASLTSPRDLAAALPELDPRELQRLDRRFAVRVNPYYLSLIRSPGDPIWRQAIPDICELDEDGYEDPLGEEADSPVPGISHRYPDRVLFCVSSVCAMYCRFCTRKRKVSRKDALTDKDFQQGLAYIRDHPEIRDVLLSGGDPLMHGDARLESILAGVRAIPHVQIIRIGTRIPVTLPQRVTPELCAMLARYHPLYINTHFNHPREITPEAARACRLLADAGIPLGNQSVLLRKVNDDAVTMTRLVQGLLMIRVRPYYIYLMDLVRGGRHFRTSVRRGLEIIGALRGHTSGLAVPTLVIDAPGGGGKIPIAPETIVSLDEREVVLRNYKGDIYRYPSHPHSEVNP
jgi:lysine 2,3-aminomutase